MPTLRAPAAVLAVLAAATLAAGCGEEAGELTEGIRDAQEQVDQLQENVDRVGDAVRDPAGAIGNEVDRAIDDALTPDILEGEGEEGE